MNIKEIKDIIKAIEGTDISEIDVHSAGDRIKIRRYLGEVTVPEKKAAKPKKTGSGVPDNVEVLSVTSPLVGTFYRSSALDSPPFVEVGQEVRKGDVLCIVESMKLMNEIETEMDGVIVSILVENGQPVEYGQSLFLLEPL
jgi:acetyl-CoA carboxylase biotin carboxyl carrier protein